MERVIAFRQPVDLLDVKDSVALHEMNVGFRLLTAFGIGRGAGDAVA